MWVVQFPFIGQTTAGIDEAFVWIESAELSQHSTTFGCCSHLTYLGSENLNDRLQPRLLPPIALP